MKTIAYRAKVFVRDGIEIVLFECRNGALPGLLVERLVLASTRRGWKVRLNIVVHTSDRGAPLFRRVSEWIAAELSLDGSGRLLDLGAGTGQVARLLRPYFARVVVVEAESEMVDYGRARSERERAWADGANRVWLHTCTLDDPAAMPNYLKRGFLPFKTEKYSVEL